MVTTMANENLNLAAAMTTAANRLLDVAESHCEEVREANAIASESASCLVVSADRLKSASDAIPKILETHVKTSLNGAAEEASRLLSAKFTEANEKASAAARRYEGAVVDYETATKMVRWKIMLPVGLFCLAVSVGVLGFAYWAVHSLTPSEAEIQGRRNQILQLNGEINARKGDIQKVDDQLAKLNKRVQSLRRAGGTLKLENCVNDQTQLCILVSDGQQWVQRNVHEASE